MPFLLKDLILIGISAILAIFVGLGLTSKDAVAPDYKVPEIIVEMPQNETTSTLPSTEAEPESEKPVNVDVEPSNTEPVAQTPKEDPFKEVADAFANLAKDQESNQTTVSDGNTKIRESLVNILCTTEGAGPLNPISASGVIIDPRGVILTNAHVAQYFLLKDYVSPDFIKCIARTGSPAEAKYKLELMFIPPSWVRDNAQKIDDEEPTGNGEHDYALLRITGTVGPNISIPSAFPFLPVSLGTPESGSSLIVAGYPAGFLGGITVQKELYAASATAKVGQLYTFEANTVDLFSIGGTIVAQQGSSGGAAANDKGVLFGLIVTSSQAPDTASRDLRALSTSYIIRDFEKEKGTDIVSFLQNDLAENARLFRLTTAPTLTKQITDVLDK